MPAEDRRVVGFTARWLNSGNPNPARLGVPPKFGRLMTPRPALCRAVCMLRRISTLPAMAFPKAFYRWRPHPWHGLEVGPDPPWLVTAYIEITPFDAVKYEVDKSTGYIRVDRPQSGAAQPPTLYGFIPRTLCGERVAQLSPGSSRGDSD